MYFRILFAGGLLWWLSCAGSLVAQAPPSRVDEADRRWHPQFDLFQLLLEEQGIKTVGSIARAMASPAISAIVITSEDGLIDKPTTKELTEFVENGGTVVLLCELNSGSRFYSDLKGLGTFYNGPVTSEVTRNRYEDYDDCLIINSISDPSDWFPGVKTIITNRGDWFVPLESSRWQWQTIATYPKTTLPSASRQKALIAVGQPTTIPLGVAVDAQGMFIVMADSSLLTNGMLWHGDNAKLALRTAELLKKQRRTQLAFLHKGQMLSSATERLADQMRKERDKLNANMPLPEPSLERMLRLGNAIAREVADSNVLNEALSRQPRRLAAKSYFEFLIGVLVAAGLLWAIWKLLSSRAFREMWLARRRMRHAYEIVSGNEVGDYRTAAGYLAREFCIQWTGSNQSSDWQQALAVLLVRSPSIVPDDKRQLTRIVDIASRGCHEHMPGLEFQHFGRTIAKLRNYIAVTV